ncbi:hypothetical protein [Streptomyces tubercidicus]
MTNEFATTVAAVAPVIMLVAAVEIKSNRNRLRDSFAQDREMGHAVRVLFANGSNPSRGEYEEVRRRLRDLRTGRLKRVLHTLYAISAYSVMASLALAETVALRWLAEGGKGADVVGASICYFVLVASFWWIVGIGAFRYMSALSRSDLRPSDAWWHVRFWALHWKYRRREPADGGIASPTE